MNQRGLIEQKMSFSVEDVFNMAYKYFSILSIMNDLDLVRRDLQLIAYSISQERRIDEVKKDFVKNFSSSMPTVGNIISKLYKKNILVKNKREVSIVPMLLLNFENNLKLDINLQHGN